MKLRDVQQFIRLNWLALLRFYNDGYTYRASAFAFTTLLALVPLLLVIVFLVTLFPAAQQISSLGEQYILMNLVPASAQAIEPYFQSFIKQSINLPAISLLFLFVTTFMLVHEIEETLNEIWQVPRRKHGHKMLALFLQWTVFLLVPFVIGWSMLLAPYVFLITWLAGTPDKLTEFLLGSLPILINTVILAALYIGVPNAPVNWRDGFLGGFIAALLFEAARVLFAFYVKQFPTYSLIYGTFAIIPIFLIWLYIFWCIVLYGALLINTKASRYHV